MDYASQNLIEALDRICKAIEDTNYQLERLNENFENVTGNFKDRTFLNVVASVHEN
ncbi:MAG: hypothetical protein K0S76_728 [Herbinix sp.]|nr:hypothetical protein [Herbinix sp.]